MTQMVETSVAYSNGYNDGIDGRPRNCPYFDKARRDDYRDGYNAGQGGDANDLFRQIEQIEAELAKPGSNKTALKSAQRKLYAQYRKLVLA